MDWLSLLIPFAYLGVLVGSLATFSSLYRRRKLQKALSLRPWFPTHVPRDIYFSLTNYEAPAPGPNEKKAQQIPETVLKAALIRRAIEDVKRLLEIRNQKPALEALLQKGSVPDTLWQRFERAEQEMDSEIRDVISEANRFVPGWGQGIFQTANEILINTAMREKMQDIQNTVKEEREWWDKRREDIQQGFMKELDEQDGSKPHSKKNSISVNSEADSVADGSSNNNNSNSNKKKKKGKK